MNTGRNPAQQAALLTRETDIVSGRKNKNNRENDTNSFSTMQPFYHGNRCGHQISMPREFKAPENHKRRFPPIQKAMKNLSHSYSDPFRFSIGRAYYHQDKVTKKNGYRKRRSESREAITHRIGQAILHTNNLMEMSCGHYNKKTGKFINYDIDYIAKLANCSKSQAIRALKVLRKYGYIDIKQNKTKLHDGTFKNLPANIIVDISFYYDLDITDEDLIEYRKTQFDKYKKEELHRKSTEYNVNKTLAKKEIKNIKKNLFDKENPGKERKRENSPIYRDYTGIAEDPSKFENNSNPTTVNNWLQKIIKDLKPPS